MLFLVIETFLNGNPDAVGIRFREKGRMIPDDVRYVDSWMSVDGARCYQIMESESREALDWWIAQWEDLVEFSVSPVIPSAEYWSRT